MRFVLCVIFIVLTAVPPSAAITIQSRIDDSSWMKKTAIYPLKGQKILLKVSTVPGAAIRWYQIFPDLSKFYKNANHPWEKNPYQWVGFGKIDYHRKELVELRGQWEIQPFETRNPGERSFLDEYASWFQSDKANNGCSQYYHNDVGSFWFQAEVGKNGRTEKSPGIEDADTRGLSPKVFRVSIRDGEGYLGYLTSFFNVPGLFGSVPYQSNNHIGADCADILMAAYGKWKGRKIKKNYNVAMLTEKFSKIDEFDLAEGTPDKHVRWGSKVRSGDFIAVRYRAGRQYQHIGALNSDANGNGQLDGQDIVIHAGPFPLMYSRLEQGGFDGHVRILRP